MASNGSFRTNYYGNACLEFAWEIQSQSVANNQTTIYYQFRAVKGDSQYYTSGNFKLTIDGNEIYSSSTRISLYNGTILKEGTYTFNHNNDGTKSFSAYIEGGIYTIAVNVTGSQTFELNKINRYPSFITNPSVTGRTLNTITFDYGATNIASDLYYSLDNSTWTHITSQSTTITGLNPETTYTIYVQARNHADNSLRTTKTISATTYAIAKISSVGNFEHGSNASVVVTNPASISSLSLVMKVGDTQILSRTVSAGTNTIIFSDTELDNLYKKYGSGTSVTATFILTGSEYTNSKTCTVTLKGNQKTTRTNVSSSWKRGKVWTNVSGNWKRAVIWTNVSGVWKRGI